MTYYNMILQYYIILLLGSGALAPDYRVHSKFLAKKQSQPSNTVSDDRPIEANHDIPAKPDFADRPFVSVMSRTCESSLQARRPSGECLLAR